MAFVDQLFTFIINVKDNGDNQSKFVFDMTAADYATAIADIPVIVAAVQGVTAAPISSYSLSQRWVQDAFGYPASGVHVEDRAEIIARILDDPVKTAKFYIPAPQADLFVGLAGPDANRINTAAPDLVTFAGLYQAGAEAFISDGENLEAGSTNGILEGKRVHRRSNYG